MTDRFDRNIKTLRSGFGSRRTPKLELIHKSVTAGEPGADLSDKQVEIKHDQRDSIKRLLLANASAITSLEEVALKWSKLDMSGDSSSKVFSESLQELDRLAARVEHYSRG